MIIGGIVHEHEAAKKQDDMMTDRFWKNYFPY